MFNYINPVININCIVMFYVLISIILDIVCKCFQSKLPATYIPKPVMSELIRTKHDIDISNWTSQTQFALNTVELFRNTNIPEIKL